MRKLPAWVLSFVFHLLLLTGIATLWTSRTQGTGQETGGPVGLAVVYESSDGEEYFLSDSASSSGAQSEQNAEVTQSALPASADSVGAQQDAVLDGILPSGDGPSGDLASAAGSFGLGDGSSQLNGSGKIPKVRTSVFGIEGEGTRFLYVFDRSDSMNLSNGRPLHSAKSELLKSLESLGPAHQFQIIFYNDTPLPFGGLGGRGPELLRGTEQYKRAAKRFVRDMSATGGTRHIDALRMALAMGPDVIFFLTDADFPAPSNRDIDNLHTRAARSGTTIHTIQFGSGPDQRGGSWIRYLAEGTGGQYKYVDVNDLRHLETPEN